MKKFIVCITAIFLTTSVFAQTDNTFPQAKKTTNKLTELYNLDSHQQAEMLKIQQLKYQNLHEIKQHETEEPQKYFKKVAALKQSHDWSVQKLLTERQMTIFQQEQNKLADKKAILYKEMKSSGAAQHEIDKKLLELDLLSLQ